MYRVVTDALLRRGTPLSKLHGHYYDDAATMAGTRSGVGTRICAYEPQAVFTYCYGHSRNLA